ncbi:GntR family transcriptional regulator [Microbacterium sp. W1N]|uniref:GntR family transcriptional regulator n=1 Tax=Microbacterium festucae TaxID=2977531 RepID=UPI0021C1D91A|nr:GntR family transcriptional regulator [Microbacterium festucae]MCT9821377.1 GntR family transcriptional regulator [Microbacterium festucae]
MTGEQAILGLRRTTLREQAIDSLRRAITTGELEPGSHVSEVDMAARLQISRGTLREAMRVLQNEGLLTSSARGRLLVRQMSDTELRDLFTVRTALEALAAQTLASRDDLDTVTGELRAALARMDAASGPPWEPRMQADLDFHRRMCELTGNDTLVRAWTALEGSIQMSIAASGVERAVRNMDVPRHLEIIDAIASGDPDTAARAVRAHMTTAVSVLID